MAISKFSIEPSGKSSFDEGLRLRIVWQWKVCTRLFKGDCKLFAPQKREARMRVHYLLLQNHARIIASCFCGAKSLQIPIQLISRAFEHLWDVYGLCVACACHMKRPHALAMHKPYASHGCSLKLSYTSLARRPL